MGDGWISGEWEGADTGAWALRAVSMGNEVARTLRGEHEVIAIRDAQQFNLGNQDAASILENMYATSADAQLARTGKDAFDAMRLIRSINRTPNNPHGGAQLYPHGADSGRSWQQLTRLIK